MSNACRVKIGNFFYEPTRASRIFIDHKDIEITRPEDKVRAFICDVGIATVSGTFKRDGIEVDIQKTSKVFSWKHDDQGVYFEVGENGSN